MAPERPRADSRQDGRIAQKRTYLPERAVAGKTLTANPTLSLPLHSDKAPLRLYAADPADLRIGGSANPQEFEDANYQ